MSIYEWWANPLERVCTVARSLSVITPVVGGGWPGARIAGTGASASGSDHQHILQHGDVKLRGKFQRGLRVSEANE